jgi:hypothetical protein
MGGSARGCVDAATFACQVSDSCVSTAPGLVVVARAGGARGQELPGDVVAVLRGPERSPAVAEGAGDLRAQDAAPAGVPVRDVDAGDLVVAVVLEAREGFVERAAYDVPAIEAIETAGTLRTRVLEVVAR